MGWIESRIKEEYRKHRRLDWARLAEIKIVMELKDRGLITMDNFQNYSQSIKSKNVHLAKGDEE